MPKRAKHPDAPKNAMGAYMWFCQEHREKVKEDSPELGAKELLSELGKRWRELQETEKEQYQNLAEADKQRFESEKEVFLRTHPSLFMEEEETTKKGKKAKKDPNAPKRARSAYILFVNDMRSQVIESAKKTGEELKPTDIMSRVAELWRNVSDEDKAKYMELSNEEKQSYQEKKATYDATLSD